MTEDEDVLFVRENGESPDDVWDDSALIKAYDKAIGLAKEEVSRRIGVESQTGTVKQNKSVSQKQMGQAKKSQRKWCVGSPCRAIYSEDGELYEAVIVKIFEDTGACIVKFIGYNNKEKVELSSLLESEGLQSQIAQQKEAATAEQSSSSMEYEETHKTNGFQDQMDCETSEAKSFKNMYIPGLPFNPDIGTIPPAPPLPPQLMARLPESDADALSSMLMSWYVSGFHTGYYHGLTQARNNQEKRNK